MKNYELKLIEKGVNKLELFFNCKDLGELKSSFKRFSKLLHPDINPDLPDVYFKDMSNDYDSYYKIHKVEHKLYPESIRLFVAGKLKVEGRRVRIS